MVTPLRCTMRQFDCHLFSTDQFGSASGFEARDFRIAVFSLANP